MKQHTARLEGVLQKLKAWHNPHIDSCERRSKRYTVRCEAKLISEPADGSTEPADQHVQIRDLSRTGAGVLCASPIDPGSRWRLQPMTDGLAIAAMPAFCRYCRKIEDGVYLVGVEFGIDAATMIALGVSGGELNRDESVGNNSKILESCQFVDPTELIDQSAA